MRTSDDLQAELEGVFGSDNVYFQPSQSTKLVYPCIVFNIDNTKTFRADNKAYFNFHCYSITHIYKSLSNSMVEELLNSFEMINHDNRQIVDGLYHDYYTLYY